MADLDYSRPHEYYMRRSATSTSVQWYPTHSNLFLLNQTLRLLAVPGED
jgi:hypothetical protein